MRLFSVRHEFPTEWARFKSAASAPARLTLPLRAEHYPFWSQASRHGVKSLDLFARIPAGTPRVLVYDRTDPGTAPVATLETPSIGDVRSARLRDISLPGLAGEITLYFSANLAEDLWLTITWGLV